MDKQYEILCVSQVSGMFFYLGHLKNMFVCCLTTQNFQSGSLGRKKKFWSLSKKKTSPVF